MMTSLMSCWRFSRRAFAAMRSMPCEGVSSMNSFAVRRMPPASMSFSMSSPVERALAQAVAIDPRLAAQHALGQFEPRLLEADEEDGLLLLDDDVARQTQAECRFPDTRPRPMIINSDRCKPAVISLRSAKPVERPLNASSEPLVRLSMRSYVSAMASSRVCRLPVTPFWATSRISRSAAATISSAGMTCL